MISLAIISDRANSIGMTIQVEFSSLTKILFWEAAKVYRESDFKESLACLHHALNEDYHTWIDRIYYHKWARSCFHMVWCNIITSNNIDPTIRYQ
uniref:Uncharacterized protein n=1 Tax=Lactuca sativa TaxID=4236 RepID=A0A9R1XT03_LACSA|nr:hypothetical protein LSAT_V11C100023540 [Lactuca sativa]